MTTRVLLADDHLLFAQAMAELLAGRYEVVGIVADGRALQAAARAHKHDVIVIDVTMPHMSGLDSIRSLRTDLYVPKTVFLTMPTDVELAPECFNCGGSAVVTKESAFDELVAAFAAVVPNHQYISPNSAAGLIGTSGAP